MEFFITLICNFVALAVAGIVFLVFNASSAISGKSGQKGTGIIIALVITIISAVASYHVLGGAGIGATLLAGVLVVAFIIFKPLTWFKRK